MVGADPSWKVRLPKAEAFDLTREILKHRFDQAGTA
jgi:hypothetical protein